MSYNLYVKLELEDRETAILYEKINSIVLNTNDNQTVVNDFKISLDPVTHICDTLTERYIDINAQTGLKNIFKYKDDLSDMLYQDINSYMKIDTNGVTDALDNYYDTILEVSIDKENE